MTSSLSFFIKWGHRRKIVLLLCVAPCSWEERVKQMLPGARNWGGRNQHTVQEWWAGYPFTLKFTSLDTEIGQDGGKKKNQKKKRWKKRKSSSQPILLEAGGCLSGFDIYSDYFFCEDQFLLIPMIAFFFHIWQAWYPWKCSHIKLWNVYG